MENKMMKNIFKVTALACLMAAASNAVAGPSANLQVKGTVTQGACTPTLSNNVIDYGSISSALLSQGNMQLPIKRTQLSINCAANTLISLSTIDNRPGTEINTTTNFTVEGTGINEDVTNHRGYAEAYGFGFAQYPGGYNSQLGSIVLTIEHPDMVTDESADFIQRDNGQAWQRNSNGITAASMREFTLAEPGTITPKAFKNLTLPLRINAALVGPVTYAGVNNLDGNISLVVNYL
ncbi:DUF1120 domain-containing protein [Ewingella sp. AOP8-B2-18]